MGSKINDDDEEYEMFMARKLPVSTFTEFDPNLPPQSGADYLRRVQLEAMKEPDIKVADDLNFLKDIPAVIEHREIDDNEFIFSLPEFKISDETIDQVVELFENLRTYIEEIREKHKPESQLNRTKRWWKEYCLNKSEECKVNLPNYECRNEYSTNLPRIAVISQLDQAEICRLLRYHLEWIEEGEYANENGIWIYSLLAGLDTVQSGDTYSLLRQISRRCSHIRHELELKSNQEVGSFQILSSLNVIIALIGKVFGQKDLLD